MSTNRFSENIFYFVIMSTGYGHNHFLHTDIIYCPFPGVFSNIVENRIEIVQNKRFFSIFHNLSILYQNKTSNRPDIALFSQNFIYQKNPSNRLDIALYSQTFSQQKASRVFTCKTCVKNAFADALLFITSAELPDKF